MVFSRLRRIAERLRELLSLPARVRAESQRVLRHSHAEARKIQRAFKDHTRRLEVRQAEQHARLEAEIRAVRGRDPRSPPSISSAAGPPDHSSRRAIGRAAGVLGADSVLGRASAHSRLHRPRDGRMARADALSGMRHGRAHAGVQMEQVDPAGEGAGRRFDDLELRALSRLRHRVCDPASGRRAPSGAHGRLPRHDRP